MKTVLVTGHRSGIGNCILKTLSGLYDVRGFSGDVSKKSDWEFTLDKFQGKIWAVINCAGIAEAKSIFDVDQETFKKMNDVNSLPILHSVQTVGKKMIEDEHPGVNFSALKILRDLSVQTIGHIVNITSVSGLTGFTYHAHYCASKWSAHGLSLVAAKELAKYGIRVNCVCPSPTDTPMWTELDKEYSALNDKEVGEMDYMQKQLIKRIGQPKDVANAVKFLISEDNQYITGTFLKVCGGNIIG